MNEPQWHMHASPEAMAAAVAEDVGRLTGEALAMRGKALLALAGGQTPWAIYTRLAAAPLGWDRVTVFPGDERCVPHDHALSNLASLRRAFANSGARVCPLEAIAEWPLWPPDLVWLGMGGDGHTASIFPGPDLETALASAARTVIVRPDPLPVEAPVERLTLTRSAIHAARALRLVFSGAEKQSLARAAIAEGAASRYPVGRVLAASAAPVIVHWCP